MSPDIIFYLFYAEVIIFSFFLLNTLIIVAYYYTSKIDDKQELFYKIIVSIFKRKKIWIDNLEDNNLKNYCQKNTLLIKINFLIVSVFVLLFIVIFFLIAFINGTKVS